MKISTNYLFSKNSEKHKNVNFNAIQMSPLSNALYTLSNNDMLSAAAVDLFATDTQRTVLETKRRGKNAGIEMGFREFTGTFIVEFSAALFALLTSNLMSKAYKPNIKINPKSWATNKTIDTFNDIFKKSDKTPLDFVKKTLNSMSGIKGKEMSLFSSIPEEKAAPIIKQLTSAIESHSLDKKQITQISKNIQNNIVEALGADNSIIVNSGKNKLNSNLSHMVRDVIDLGRNVFFNSSVKNTDEVVSKLKTLNKARVGIAIPAAMMLAISNQYINRQLTKKRTGIDNFVGENGYENNVKNQNQQNKEKGLLAKKLLSAGIFVLMLSKVMGVKNPKELIKTLEFTGPATAGNTIKTVYGTLIVGRIMASKSSTELRETNTRDYLGFLNWLVLGDYVSKGVGQLLDPKKKDLFNIAKEGKGISHWLKDVSLKSQKEIIAHGGNVSKNLRKLNIAQLSGIAYSAVMLGLLLPKFNIWMTQRKAKNQDISSNISYNNPFLQEMTLEKFDKELANNNSNKF